MEERIIDDEDARLIKIKRTKDGEDVVEDTAEDTDGELAPEEGEGVEEEFDESFVLEYNGDDYDEDLVGLTPSQLKAELERREKAQREAREQCDRLVAEGEKALKNGDFEDAEDCFATAVSYDMQSEAANEGLWAARTKNFTQTDAYFDADFAREFAAAPESVKKRILEKDGAKLGKIREQTLAEIEPLKERVEGAREARRGPFRANRNYYLLRLGICGIVFILGIVGVVLGAYYTVRTTTVAPFIAIGVCGFVALVGLVLVLLFLRKFIVAVRLCLENEREDGTEDGKRLAELTRTEYCLKIILDGASDEEEERAEEAEQAE